MCLCIRSAPPNSRNDLARFDLVHVAPGPELTRLDRANQRMLRLVKVLCGVLVLGRIAAANMTTDEAQAQMDPSIANLDTLFTYMCFRFAELDLIEVLAFLHRQLRRFDNQGSVK
jgi:hypothetical protein